MLRGTDKRAPEYIPEPGREEDNKLEDVESLTACRWRSIALSRQATDCRETSHGGGGGYASYHRNGAHADSG